MSDTFPHTITQAENLAQTALGRIERAEELLRSKDRLFGRAQDVLERERRGVNGALIELRTLFSQLSAVPDAAGELERRIRELLHFLGVSADVIQVALSIHTNGAEPMPVQPLAEAYPGPDALDLPRAEDADAVFKAGTFSACAFLH